MGSAKVVIQDAKTILDVLSILKVKKVSPSGGISKYRLKWHFKDNEYRNGWVFPYGECGFTRPGTNYSIGSDSDIPKKLDEIIDNNTK